MIMEADNSKVFEGFRGGDLYIVDFSTGPQPTTCLLAKASEGWLWHRRLGHAGMRNLHTLAKKKHVIGIEGVKFLKDHLCGACEARKMTKAKHPAKTIMTTTRPFELLTWISSVLIIILLLQIMHLYMALLLLMIILVTHGYTLLLTNMKCGKSSNDFPRGLQPTLV